MARSETTVRAIEMLNIAARYIREWDPTGTITYDEAKCDGYCVAEDCEAVAADLGREEASRAPQA